MWLYTVSVKSIYFKDAVWGITTRRKWERIKAFGSVVGVYEVLFQHHKEIPGRSGPVLSDMY